MKKLDELWWNETDNSLVRRVQRGFAPINATGDDAGGSSYRIELSSESIMFFHDGFGGNNNVTPPFFSIKIFSGNSDVTNGFILNATGSSVTGFWGSGSLRNTYFVDSCSSNTEITVSASSISAGTLYAVVKVAYTFIPVKEQIDTIQSTVEAGLNPDGTLVQPINSNTMIVDVSPNMDGLYLTKDRMGLYYGGVWRSYIQSDGKFGFIGDSSNYVQWNGTKLEVRGDVEFTGDVALNGVVNLGDEIKSSNFNAGISGWSIKGDGNAELNNVAIRGQVNALSGNIAGNVITSTKLYQGNGNFNNADTPFYLDNTGKMSLKDKFWYNGTTLYVNGAINTANITATGGSIGCTTITGTKIFQGNGNYNNTDTPYYIDNTGKFSLRDKLFFDGTNLTISGTVNATSGSFTGTVNATSGTFTGDINTTNIIATGGTIGGWNIGTDKLISATSGSILEMSKGLSRISIKNNNDTKVAMGYLNGLAKHEGGTYGPGEYGFWAAPGDKITFDGLVDVNGNALSVIDGALILSVNTMNGVKEVARFGTVSSATGMHFYNTNNVLTSTSIIAGPYETDTGSGISAMQIITNRNGVMVGTLGLGFSTSDGSYYEPTMFINNPIKITSGIKSVGNIELMGTSQIIGNVKAARFEMNNNQVFLDGNQFIYPWQTTTANPTFVLCETSDNASWPAGTGKLTKKKAIPSFVWALDHSSHSNSVYINDINQYLSTTSSPTFSKLTLTSSYGTISNLATKNIMYRDTDGTVREGTLPSDVCNSSKVTDWNTAYTNTHTHSNKATLDGINQGLATTSVVQFARIVVNGNIGRTDDTDLITLSSANNVTINGNLTVTGTNQATYAP